MLIFIFHKSRFGVYFRAISYFGYTLEGVSVCVCIQLLLTCVYDLYVCIDFHLNSEFFLCFSFHIWRLIYIILYIAHITHNIYKRRAN